MQLRGMLHTALVSAAAESDRQAMAAARAVLTADGGFSA